MAKKRKKNSDEKKKKLLGLPKGAPRPHQGDDIIGVALTRYTSPSSNSYDQEFDRKVRAKFPQWFIGTADIKKQILSMPKDSKRPRGRLLIRYTNPENASYDPIFDKEVRERFPNWFTKGIPHTVGLERWLIKFKNSHGFPDFPKDIKDVIRKDVYGKTKLRPWAQTWWFNPEILDKYMAVRFKLHSDDGNIPYQACLPSGLVKEALKGPGAQEYNSGIVIKLSLVERLRSLCALKGWPWDA